MKELAADILDNFVVTEEYASEFVYEIWKMFICDFCFFLIKHSNDHQFKIKAKILLRNEFLAQMSVEKYFSLETIILVCWAIRSASSSLFFLLITTVYDDFGYSLSSLVPNCYSTIFDPSSFFTVL